MVVSYILSQQAHIAILVGLKPWGEKKGIRMSYTPVKFIMKWFQVIIEEMLLLLLFTLCVFFPIKSQKYVPTGKKNKFDAELWLPSKLAT